MRDPLAYTKNTHPRLTVGEKTYGTPIVHWWGEEAMLVIGRYCSIEGNVQVYIGGNHHTDWVTTYPLATALRIEGYEEATTKGNVTIGNDVWIGNNASILSGVTICNGAVIGACSVVAKDVPAYAVVAGNPAKVMKYRFDKDTIAALEDIAWWKWPESKIKENINLLLSGDVQRFIAVHGQAVKPQPKMKARRKCTQAPA